MDIYFATSMRKRWEFEDLHDFVSALVSSDELRSLKVRYFDPTQSFDKNRINKGLIEALMLKRARCTVYSVQDTDTLGKDSELAATLAQGKPVVAYSPKIDVESRTAQLSSERPAVLLERLQFVVYADDGFARSVASEDWARIQGFAEKLEEFEGRMPWRSMIDTQSVHEFGAANADDLRMFGRAIAESEKRIYDRRARTLLASHPLAIQVNLDTGVANGVLVARDIGTCARLVRRILTNTMEYRVRYDEPSECWFLEEELTGSVFRVVTSNVKLTNCFWNFYGSRDV